MADEWLTAEELRDNPLLCEECGTEPASFHGADGWLCDDCLDELYPPYEG